VGRSLETTFPEKARVTETATPIYEVLDARSTSFAQVSMKVRAGEIVGLAGVEGNGQREFLRALAGLDPLQGEVRIQGEPVKVRSARSVARSGIKFLPGDRLGEALFGRLSVRENIVAASMTQAMPKGVTNRRRESELTVQAIGNLAVKTPNFETSINSLSGGSQQKVLLARSRLGEA
jgi:ribose transport system ATP-binding protein